MSGGWPTAKYEFRIKLGAQTTQKVVIEADNAMNAKRMVEEMYGKGSIMWGPNRLP